MKKCATRSEGFSNPRGSMSLQNYWCIAITGFSVFANLLGNALLGARGTAGSTGLSYFMHISVKFVRKLLYEQETLIQEATLFSQPEWWGPCDGGRKLSSEVCMILRVIPLAKRYVLVMNKKEHFKEWV